MFEFCKNDMKGYMEDKFNGARVLSGKHLRQFKYRKGRCLEIPWEVFAFSFIKVFLYIKEYVLNLECCIFQMEVTGALHGRNFCW